jgi:transposase
MGTRGLTIRTDLPAAELRRLARREKDRAAAARMQAIAGALEGLTRAEAARLAGMERQALRDAVVRYNAEGLAGLHSRRGPGRRSRLNEEQRAALRQVVLDGPEVEATGLSAWTLPERAGRSRSAGASRTTLAHGQADAPPRPVAAEGAALAPEGGRGGAEAFAKGGCRPPWTTRGRSTPASA